MASSSVTSVSPCVTDDRKLSKPSAANPSEVEKAGSMIVKQAISSAQMSTVRVKSEAIFLSSVAGAWRMARRSVSMLCRIGTVHG